MFFFHNKGGSIGITTSLVFLLWVGLGTNISGTSVTIKPGVSTVGCNWNLTGFGTTTIATTPARRIPLYPEATTSVYDKYS